MSPLPKYCLFCFKDDEKELKITKSKKISFKPKTKKVKLQYLTKKSHASADTNKFYALCDQKSCERQHDHGNKVIKIKVIKWGGKCQIFINFTYKL